MIHLTLKPMRYPSDSGELVGKRIHKCCGPAEEGAVFSRGIRSLCGIGHVPHFLKVHLFIFKEELVVGSSRA